MPTFHVEMRWCCSACQVENLGRHKVCQHCSKPKDREPFYDAPDTSGDQAVRHAVSDAELVAKATAGADWACRYCGTHQRQGVTECANCGAPAAEAQTPPTYAHAPDEPDPTPASAAAMTALASEPERNKPPRRRFKFLLVATLLLFIACVFWIFRPRVIEARVAQRAWEHTIVVERYQIVRADGFSENRPKDAFDVVRVGERHHHDDRVQDGTERESYTEQVACGEDCSTSSVTCSTNDNGFKTCSGGDRECRTRYCSETRYRDVPRYKTVPVYQPWYTWRVWQWKVDRSISERGADDEPRWPSDERVELGRRCGPGEKERARRESKYEIWFQDEEQTRYPFRARDIDQFGTLRSGTVKTIRVGLSRDAELVEQR